MIEEYQYPTKKSISNCSQFNLGIKLGVQCQGIDVKVDGGSSGMSNELCRHENPGIDRFITIQCLSRMK